MVDFNFTKEAMLAMKDDIPMRIETNIKQEKTIDRKLSQCPSNIASDSSSV